jgi:hypothetical protein
MSTLSEVNYQLESRMREIRTSGSEGGGMLTRSPYPYQGEPLFRTDSAECEDHRLRSLNAIGLQTCHAADFYEGPIP